MKDVYSQFHREQLTLRDELALDRTVLANERTMLGYVRTALAFLVLGLTLLHFLAETYFHVAGYVFMFVAVFVLLVGIFRFLKMRRELRRIRLATTWSSVDEAPGKGSDGQ